ncbi:hypothetical protein SAMN04488027_103150 [Psychroflexus sediminis]|uniref:Uncharacterized protein n=2 Tax=Psychroflexus sediminis TaxID=470826 RepID=A0A1G7V815_9FLAO|nr:hypothetical protein SAMN04488027_103150 [Psychroflexus sediminis]
MHKSISTNIIRDEQGSLNYIVTPNAEETFENIFSNINKGYHSFNLIGSFGTGKSSFLLAFEQTLTNKLNHFQSQNNYNSEFVKIIGDYKSFNQALNEEFDIENDHDGNQKLFDKIFQRYENITEKNGHLFILVDEFGKFLEYAANESQEKEIYFIQKLAEFVNKADRNIILITSIHQSLESYAHNLKNEQIQEWRKVKGRFIDLTFNEPVEHLVHLASNYINYRGELKHDLTWKLVEKYQIFNTRIENFHNIEPKLFPLNAISGLVVAKALQTYGQNERSLFTFLNSSSFENFKQENKSFRISDVYDYLLQDFYNYINSKSNPDFSNWSSIKSSLERVENFESHQRLISEKLIKTIGLLNVFCSKAAILNSDFLKEYFDSKLKKDHILANLELLEKHKVIRFSKFDNSYKLFEGTDLDIESAISKAENKVIGLNLVGKLNSYFNFPVLLAKSVSYKFGTPRLFEFKLTEEPINEKAEGQIDGFINLVFNVDNFNQEKVLEYSSQNPTLYGYFKNTTGIKETLLEIEKTNEVLKEMRDENDRVAIRELQSIVKSNENLLNHYVINSLYTDRVNWFANGEPLNIQNKKEFNKILSKIAEATYTQTPVLQNELFNRHKTSGSISSARKNLWNAITQFEDKEDLGFPKDKWPAEKTVYYSLLKRSGIHQEINGKYAFQKPTQDDIMPLWKISEEFLDDAKTSKKKLTDFEDVLSKAPIKLKKGVIDFWIPIFLFIKRGDFALYNDNGFVPVIDEVVLYQLTRNLKEYSLKSFELNDLRLSLFNKYRDFLQQENTDEFSTDSFIESIRPLLIFYRDLPEYNKKTKTISKEAIQLRDAISKARDPEQTFFEEFPSALGYSLQELTKSDELFENYIIDFQNRIQEIKTSFDDLLDRFELFICDEVIGERLSFGNYQKKLKDRFSAVKEHQALTRHKVFLMRINSALNDRNSYLMSLSQALINKGLDKIDDKDELLLKERFLSIVNELDNLVDLHKLKPKADERVAKLQITSLEDGGKEQTIRINKNQEKEIEEAAVEILSSLNKHKKIKLPILLSILEKELKNG